MAIARAREKTRAGSGRATPGWIHPGPGRSGSRSGQTFTRPGLTIFVFVFCPSPLLFLFGVLVEKFGLSCAVAGISLEVDNMSVAASGTSCITSISRMVIIYSVVDCVRMVDCVQMIDCVHRSALQLQP